MTALSALPNGQNIGPDVIVNGLIISAATVLQSVKQFGAIGNGIADDTAAFNEALATGNPIYVPPGIYLVSNLRLLSGSSLIGFGALSYGSLTNTVLRGKSGSTTVLDTGNAEGWYASGLCIDGVDRSCDGILATTGGSDTSGTAENCVVRFCNRGLGGTPSHYAGILSIKNCVSINNNIGICNLIDSRINSCIVAANINQGIYFTDGSDDCLVTNTKIEFNQDHGILIGASTSISGTNNIFDRNYGAGVHFSGSNNCSFDGSNIWKRNGRNGTAGSRSHWSYSGTCTNIIIGAGTTTHGTDDDGGGPDTPAYCYEFSSATSSVNLGITAIAMGGFVTAESIGTPPTAGLVIDNNPGGMSYVVGQQINADSGRLFQSEATSGTILTTASATFAMTQYPVNTFSNAIRELSVWVRDSNTGGDYLAKFNVVLQREGSGATMTASAAYGEIGGAGKITVAGAGTIVNLVFSGVATDGSTFNIVATNNDANSIQVHVEFK